MTTRTLITSAGFYIVSGLLQPAAAQSLARRVIVTPETAAAASVTTPIYAGGGDYVSDITGTPDAHFWGTSGYADTLITFHPPAGYRVRLLTADAVVSSYVHGNVLPGAHTGASWGLVTTQTANSGRADNLNDNCMVYVKQSLSAAKDTDTTVKHQDIANGVLGPDNVLVSRNAVYLNETGLPVHMEIALEVTYTFEPAESVQQ